MSVRLDDIEIDVLSTLTQNPNHRLQRCNIRNNLTEKYKKYAEDSFNNILQRKLSHLCSAGLLKKDDVGHQQVYYHIPKEKQQEVNQRLDKEELKTRWVNMVDSAAPEEIKRLKAHVRKLERSWRLFAAWVPEVERRNALFRKLGMKEEKIKT